MEKPLMIATAGGIRKFYEAHCELMKTMIPAVEAVEQLASADSSSESSEAAKSKAQNIDAPQDYLSLPTVHIAETATAHISQAVENIREICASDEKIPQASVRPLLDRLCHLLTLCELHHLVEALLACGRAAVALSRRSERPCDAAFFAARVVLFLSGLRPVPGDPLREALREFLEQLDSPDAAWPELKALVVETAKLTGAGALAESPAALLESFEGLGSLDARHRAFLGSKVKEAVLARAVLLRAKLLLRLRAGPLLPPRDETPLDAALLLRRLGYSLVRFHFDRMNRAPQPKRAGKDRHQDESWQAVTLLMSGCYWTCWTHTFVGANREARCYLREFMKYAQTYYLPYRAHACLTLHAHLDLHGKLEYYRPVRLSQMKHILSDQTIPKMFSFINESADGDDDDSFLHRVESPRVVRDEHLPDPQQRAAHVTSEFGASPTLSEGESDTGRDLYTAEEPRLAWLKSAIHVLEDTNHVKDLLADFAVASKRPKKAEEVVERDDDIASLISLVSDLRTPSTEADTATNAKAPCAPRKNLGETRRPTRKRQAKAGKGETFDAEGVARMCSHLAVPVRRGRRGAKVLADSTNVAASTPVAEAAAKAEEEEEDVEFCPTARFVPRNVRLARRLELQRSLTAAERVRSAEPMRGESLLPLQPDGLPELESKRSGIDPDLLARLEAAYRDLSWFPPADLFRRICHRLAAHFLLAGDISSASFYLTQSIFVAMKQTYQSNLVQKLRRGTDAERWEKALRGCRAAFADIPAWRAAVDQLPGDWTVLQFSCVEDDAGQLLVTRLQPAQEPCSKLCAGFAETGLSLLGEFDVLMQDNIDAMSLPSRKDWWESRYRLNDAIADWAKRCRAEWFPAPLLSWMLSGAGPVILILDRRLNSLPFELILQSEPTRVFTRMTNLAVILAHFCQVRDVLAHGVDLRKAFYVLNPDKDLDGTQTSLQPVFDSFGWSGLVGQQPKEEDLLKALGQYDLLAYCGHGSGTKYLHLQALQNSTSRAVALLVGCSSGKLYPEGAFEPNGNVLSHIIAGSPSVLALLWDVTDRDIDRYFKKLLLDWWGDSSEPFGVLARRSRSACKLLFLVGCAPVIYGLPIDKHRA